MAQEWLFWPKIEAVCPTINLSPEPQVRPSARRSMDRVLVALSWWWCPGYYPERGPYSSESNRCSGIDESCRLIVPWVVDPFPAIYPRKLLL